MQSKVAKWYQEQIAMLQTSFAALQQQPGMHQMHDLRVGVKALRAVLDNVRSGDASFGKAFPAIGYLYKLSGKKRDALMMLQRLKTLPAWSEHPRVIRRLSKKANQANRSLEDYLETPGTAKTILTDCQQLGTLQPSRQEVLAAWKQLGNLPIPNHQQHWHAWRKSLKQRFYLGKALGLAQEKLQGLQYLQHAIGEWHDWENAMLFLHKNRKPHMQANEWLLLQQANLHLDQWAATIRYALAHHQVT